MNEETNSAWHLDKKVPLGLFLIIALQTMTLIYVGTAWKSDIDNRMIALEKENAKNESTSTRLTILEQQYIFITTTLNRIVDKLDSAKMALDKKDSN